MVFAKINNCPIYKEGQIVEINRYLFDKEFNITNILFEDSTVMELSKCSYVRTIHKHYIRLGNAIPLVTTEDLRYIKLKKILNGISNH